MTNLVDSFTLDGIRKTKDGYLAAFACVARTGVQKYKGKELGRPDLGDVMVYRPPEEVFNKDALHSMAHRPVTLLHPTETVDAKNWKKYAKGHTGDEVVRDGDHVRVPMVLMDAAAIEAVEGGTRELSMGYSTDLKWEAGVTDVGEKYDAVQTQIRANHLAIPKARGGETLKIGDDDQTECPECGADVDEEDDICPECGKPLENYSTDAGYDESQHPRGDKGLWTHIGGQRAKTPEEHTKAAQSHAKAAELTRQAGFEDIVPKLHEVAAQLHGQAAGELASGHKFASDTSRRARGASVGANSMVVVYPAKGKVDTPMHKTAEEALAKQKADRVARKGRTFTGEKGPSDQYGKNKALFNELYKKDADLMYDRDFSEEERSKAAESGAAMPDGSFPIKNTSDLHNAIKAVGRAKDPAAAKKHIISRARALGAAKELPEGWTNDGKDSTMATKKCPECDASNSADAATCNDCGAKFNLKDAAAGGTKKGKTNMSTVTIDGVAVEVADDLSSAIINAKIKTLGDEIESLKADGVKKQVAVDSAAGEITVLKKQVADAVVTPEKLDVLVTERSGVITAASTLLDSRTFEFGGKSLEDIRRSAVAAKLGDPVVKDMSDASIEGAFKALTVDAPKGGTRALADNLNRPGNTKYQDTRDAAYADYEKNLTNGWKGRPAAAN